MHLLDVTQIFRFTSIELDVMNSCITLHIRLINALFIVCHYCYIYRFLDDLIYFFLFLFSFFTITFTLISNTLSEHPIYNTSMRTYTQKYREQYLEVILKYRRNVRPKQIPNSDVLKQEPIRIYQFQYYMVRGIFATSLYR